MATMSMAKAVIIQRILNELGFGRNPDTAIALRLLARIYESNTDLTVEDIETEHAFLTADARRGG